MNGAGFADEGESGGDPPIPPGVEVEMRGHGPLPVVVYSSLLPHHRERLGWLIQQIAEADDREWIRWEDVIVRGDIDTRIDGIYPDAEAGLQTRQDPPFMPPFRMTPDYHYWPDFEDKEFAEFADRIAVGPGAPLGGRKDGREEWIAVSDDALVDVTELDPEEGQGRELRV